MTTSRLTSVAKQREVRQLAVDARVMLKRLDDRIVQAYQSDDAETIRWLHKQIISVERRAQERTTSNGE
jgi:Fic family protein